MGACELRRGLYMHVHQRGNRAEGGFGDGFGVLTAKFDTHAHKAVSVHALAFGAARLFHGCLQNV